jgi:hypothetical protein
MNEKRNGASIASRTQPYSGVSFPETTMPPEGGIAEGRGV